MMNTRVIKEVISLQTKSLDELRDLYERLFCEPANVSANRLKLIPRIAYRLQELALGGLTPDTSSRLETIAAGGKPDAAHPYHNLTPGTKIRREWNEVVYEVEVTQTGFEYQGQPFASLSPIATKITGVRRNGPKFFGLRNKRS